MKMNIQTNCPNDNKTEPNETNEENSNEKPN